MTFFNLKRPDETADFARATRKGLGSDRGLYHPTSIPTVDAERVLAAPRFERYRMLLGPLTSPAFTDTELDGMIREAFPFEAKVRPVGGVFALELFHGPTLAFKDFGARWMARCLSRLRGDGPMTILTATSGDTGAAVAHAFLDVPGIRVVVLYPEGRISRAQEQLFCTLGRNIETIAVDGSFDDCQAMVKAAFDAEGLRERLGLNSANSINVSRLVAQVLYYWDLAAALRGPGAAAEMNAAKASGAAAADAALDGGKASAAGAGAGRDGGLVVSVPSGNFGDLTAGLIAKAMGAPIARFVAATNLNDTVPRYLENGRWEPAPTVATASNAMDVSQPSNWPRAERIISDYGWELSGESVDEADTVGAMRALDSAGYVGEPHGAVAYEALRRSLRPSEVGAFLCTAHPAKFAGPVEAALGRKLEIPPAIADAMGRKNLSVRMKASSEALAEYLKGGRG